MNSPYRQESATKQETKDQRVKHLAQGEEVESGLNLSNHYNRPGCQTHFHGGSHQPRGCLQRAEIILGLSKCNYSLTVKELELHSAL